MQLTAADDHTFGAYRVEPPGAARGAVIVIQEIFGVNGHIRSVADRVAEAGYVAVAPYLFDRVGPGIELGYDAEGVERGRDVAWNLPLIDTMEDLRTTAADLAGEMGGADRVGAVGFCYGGMLAAAMTSRVPRHFGAAVAYYPSMAAQLLTKDQPHLPLLVHLGDTDARVTPEDGRTLEARWPDATFHRYPAGHGFNCELRPDFDEAAAALAWERTLAFLGDHLDAG